MPDDPWFLLFVLPGAGSRSDERLRRYRRGLSHVCAVWGRQGAVLGTERRRPTRRRDFHELVHPLAGGWTHRCRRRQRRVLSHLCAAWGRHGAVLGPERRGAAGGWGVYRDARPPTSDRHHPRPPRERRGPPHP